MTLERISRASAFDPDSKTIVTHESNFLVDGELKSPILNNGAFDYRLLTSLGVNNHRTYLARIKDRADEDENSTDHLLRKSVEAYDWSRVVLGRELAARAYEMAILADADPSNVAEYVRIFSKEGTYDKARLLRSGSPDLKHIAKTAKRELDAGRSLGDLIAQERAHVESTGMTYFTSAVGNLAERELTLLTKNGFGQKRRRQRLEILKDTLATDGLAGVEKNFIMSEIDLGAVKRNTLMDEDAAAYDIAANIAKVLIPRRETAWEVSLTSEPETTYHYVPSNTELYAESSNKSGESQPERERIIAAPTEEEIEAGRRARQEQDERLRAREEATAAEAEAEKQAIAEHNAPILQELERIKAEYDQLVGRFKAQPKGKLKQSGIIGNNSLTYTISQLKGQNLESAEPIARVYEGLTDVVKTSGEQAEQELTDILLKIEELRAEFTSYLNEHPLRNGAAARLEKIGGGITDELNWITTHWQEFTAAQRKSNYKAASKDELERIAHMLGIGREGEMVMPVDEGSVEIIEDEPEDEIDTSEEPEESEPEEEEAEQAPIQEVEYESPLAKANRLAEQLNWIVLPDEIITPDDLVDIAEEVTKKRSKDNKPAVVERYRMEALLQLRDTFGGTLYRSEERMLDDTNNLYFVLRFQHPGDDNYYAVAENPVYGNATYVLREDALPLMEGESVLAALQLYRRDARDLGAKRIIHGTPSRETHLEKVNDKLVELSERERVA